MANIASQAYADKHMRKDLTTIDWLTGQDVSTYSALMGIPETRSTTIRVTVNAFNGNPFNTNALGIMLRMLIHNISDDAGGRLTTAYATDGDTIWVGKDLQLGASANWTKLAKATSFAKNIIAYCYASYSTDNLTPPTAAFSNMLGNRLACSVRLHGDTRGNQLPPNVPAFSVYLFKDNTDILTELPTATYDSGSNSTVYSGPSSLFEDEDYTGLIITTEFGVATVGDLDFSEVLHVQSIDSPPRIKQFSAIYLGNKGAANSGVAVNIRLRGNTSSSYYVYLSDEEETNVWAAPPGVYNSSAKETRYNRLTPSGFTKVIISRQDSASTGNLDYKQIFYVQGIADQALPPINPVKSTYAAYEWDSTQKQYNLAVRAAVNDNIDRYAPEVYAYVHNSSNDTWTGLNRLPPPQVDALFTKYNVPTSLNYIQTLDWILFTSIQNWGGDIAAFTDIPTQLYAYNAITPPPVNIPLIIEQGGTSATNADDAIFNLKQLVKSCEAYYKGHRGRPDLLIDPLVRTKGNTSTTLAAYLIAESGPDSVKLDSVSYSDNTTRYNKASGIPAIDTYQLCLLSTDTNMDFTQQLDWSKVVACKAIDPPFDLEAPQLKQCSVKYVNGALKINITAEEHTDNTKPIMGWMWNKNLGASGVWKKMGKTPYNGYHQSGLTNYNFGTDPDMASDPNWSKFLLTTNETWMPTAGDQDSMPDTQEVVALELIDPPRIYDWKDITAATTVEWDTLYNYNYIYITLDSANQIELINNPASVVRLYLGFMVEARFPSSGLGNREYGLVIPQELVLPIDMIQGLIDLGVGTAGNPLTVQFRGQPHSGGLSPGDAVVVNCKVSFAYNEVGTAPNVTSRKVYRIALSLYEAPIDTSTVTPSITKISIKIKYER